ncbi:MAG: hypothetical protein FJ034_01635 [Chloroflexi bacterium]|nr:hypothetical protein [Chloroflexota bacterium]
MSAPSGERTAPSIEWLALASGLVLALSLDLMLSVVRVPPVVGPLAGCGFGGFLAGRLAKRGGLLHGAYVGAGWIALEAFGVVPSIGGAPGGGVVAETVTIIALDAVLLAVTSAGGWLAKRS